MITIEVNGLRHQVPSSESIIQSLYRVGIEIPRFCYHERLSIAGNCRMCLVEVAFPLSKKPIASCALMTVDNMKIFTNTVMIQKARESVLEFLLANHPLDCPVCDQGGECDLQDETLLFGNDRGRFYENKRAVQDKDCGPLIKTVMTRCIHCTRCIRFCTEIAGIDTLGTVGRGSSMEVGTYVENLIDSEISGNIIDLCPVGALTSKPYSFTTRPWEIRSVTTIDVLDSFCNNIRVDVRGSDIMRILPVTGLLNDDWISDKTRFFYDGVSKQRLYKPLVKTYTFFISLSWDLIFDKLSRFLMTYLKSSLNFFTLNLNSHTSIVGSLGKTLDASSVLIFREFIIRTGGRFLHTDNGGFMKSFDFRTSYVTKIFKKLNYSFFESDVVVLLNLNLRLDFPLLNVKLRRSFLDKGLFIVTLGVLNNLNYFNFHISNNIKTFIDLIYGKHLLCRKLLKSNYTLFLYSNRYNIRQDFSLFNEIKMIYDSYLTKIKYDFINLTLNTTDIISYDLGLFDQYYLDYSDNFDSLFYYSLGGELTHNLILNEPKKSVFIYQGHHGDALTFKSDFVLPSVMFFEKAAWYLNFEGELRKSKFVLTPLGSAREDWQIIVFFMLYCLKNYSNNFKFLTEIEDSYLTLNSIKSRLQELSSFFMEFKLKENFFSFESDLVSIDCMLKINNISFSKKEFNFYMSDSITRSSEVMALCTQRFVMNKTNFI